MAKSGTVEKCFNSLATVFVARDSACEGCASCAGCGAKGMKMTVDNSIGAKVGDIVEIYESEKSNLPVAALVFIAPVLVPLIIYTMLESVNEKLAICGAALSLIIWGIAVFFTNKKLKNDPERLGRITRIISNGEV